MTVRLVDVPVAETNYASLFFITLIQIIYYFISREWLKNNVCKPSGKWSPIHPFPYPLSLLISQSNPYDRPETASEFLDYRKK